MPTKFHLIKKVPASNWDNHVVFLDEVVSELLRT